MGAALCRPEVPITLLSNYLFISSPLPQQKVDFDGPPNLYHFNLLRSIGKGAFGKVDRNSIPLLSFSTLSHFIGPDRSTQTDESSIRFKVHQQAEMHKDESCPKYNTRTEASGRGASCYISFI